MLVKPLSPTGVILVSDSIDISHLNNILTLRYCIGESLPLKVVPRYWSCKYIKIVSFGCRLHLWCVLTEEWQLRWIGKSRIFSPFGGRLGQLHVRDCKGGFVWRKLCVWILWGNGLSDVTGETENGVGVRSNQFVCGT